MTESPSGKVSSCETLNQQSVGRPKIPRTVSGLQMATECFGAPDFAGDHR